MPAGVRRLPDPGRVGSVLPGRIRHRSRSASRSARGRLAREQHGSEHLANVLGEEERTDCEQHRLSTTSIWVRKPASVSRSRPSNPHTPPSTIARIRRSIASSSMRASGYRSRSSCSGLPVSALEACDKPLPGPPWPGETIWLRQVDRWASTPPRPASATQWSIRHDNSTALCPAPPQRAGVAQPEERRTVTAGRG